MSWESVPNFNLAHFSFGESQRKLRAPDAFDKLMASKSGSATGFGLLRPK